MRSLIFLAAACLALTSVAADQKKIVCYFGSWAVYRPLGGKFAIEDIDPTLCTHLIYTFVGLQGNDVKVLDGWQDLPEDYGKDGFGRFNALRKRSPTTKTLVAIGGWNEGSTKYSQMASTENSRAHFIKMAVQFVKKHNFDGFDLDWEYPAQRGGSSQDVQNFVSLVREMREVFDKEGLLLTAAVGAAKSSASQSYDIPQISKYLHFINLMTYDLHGSWESQTGINAPLYPGSSDTGFARELTVDAAVKYWLSQGIDPQKLIVGIPAYGRTFTLSNSNVATVGASTTGPGSAGPYTREPGFLGYNEICQVEKNSGWTVHFDNERLTPYASQANQWVGYDNPESVKYKAEYIKDLGLGGAMVWSIETDDFGGNCGEKYPLIKTLNRVLRPDTVGTEGTTEKFVPRTTTTTTTTTVQPTHKSVTNEPDHHTNPSTEDNDGFCKAAGNIPDPTGCERFFQCVPQGGNRYTRITITCPQGLCFKPESGNCDWK